MKKTKTKLRTSVQPLHDRVLVKIDLPRGEGRIIIPEAYRKEARTGEVLAVGPGRWREYNGEPCFCRTVLRPGQRVLVSPAVNINYDDILKQDGTVMIQEDDVMGIIPPDAKVEVGEIEWN